MWRSVNDAARRSYCSFRHGDTGKYGLSEEDNFVLELASGYVRSVLFAIRELGWLQTPTVERGVK